MMVEGNEYLSRLCSLYHRAFQGAQYKSIQRADAIIKLIRRGAYPYEATVIAEALLPRMHRSENALSKIFQMNRTKIRIDPSEECPLTVDRMVEVYGEKWERILDFFKFMSTVNKSDWERFLAQIRPNFVGEAISYLVLGLTSVPPYPGSSAQRVAMEVADYAIRTMEAYSNEFNNLIINVVTTIELEGIPGKERSYQSSVKASELWVKTFGTLP